MLGEGGWEKTNLRSKWTRRSRGRLDAGPPWLLSASASAFLTTDWLFPNGGERGHRLISGITALDSESTRDMVSSEILLGGIWLSQLVSITCSQANHLWSWMGAEEEGRAGRGPAVALGNKWTGEGGMQRSGSKRKEVLEQWVLQ